MSADIRRLLSTCRRRSCLLTSKSRLENFAFLVVLSGYSNVSILPLGPLAVSESEKFCLWTQ